MKTKCLVCGRIKDCAPIIKAGWLAPANYIGRYLCKECAAVEFTINEDRRFLTSFKPYIQEFPSKCSKCNRKYICLVDSLLLCPKEKKGF